MKTRVVTFAVIAGMIAALSLAGPAQSEVPALSGGIESASAQKSNQKSGGQAEQVGENAADLFSGWLAPLLFVAIGAFAFVALIKREVGLAVSGTLVGLVAGLFLLAPDAAERTFTGIYDRIF